MGEGPDAEVHCKKRVALDEEDFRDARKRACLTEVTKYYLLASSRHPDGEYP
jgi:hypothetical protein